ncbi:ribonuclease III [Tilletiaria anomala UBC 951]|uniref:Large ribosomal subunit protein mL44 n=1 Tax=Tilletiaria anomala (strain ATCC 24038 / CBS 436.72 / UBC 951) TaxID=1037660 RepID=A0A066VJB2_TILAU|nr:ribonuclease III [Tilletiaria anomala UBC 951]KDN38695.1 ribonuclease III [Tilletiaria anomala UBC 951]
MASRNCAGLAVSAAASSSRQSALLHTRALSTTAPSSSQCAPVTSRCKSRCSSHCNEKSSHWSGAGLTVGSYSRARQVHSSTAVLAPPKAASPSAPAGSLPPFARRHPQLYAAIQPPPNAALAALAARLRLIGPSSSKEEQERRIRLVAQACTHPSFAQVLQRARDAQRKLERPGAESSVAIESDVQHNAQLEALGNSLLGLLGSEALHLKYPHLPTRVLKAALSAYVGSNTTADVGGELGLAAPGMIRWDRGEEGEQMPRKTSPSKPAEEGRSSPVVSSKDARSSSVKALIGLIYQENGIDAVKDLLHTRFLSRTVDLAGMLKFEDPKRVLSNTCLKYGRERPQSRMIAETGRLSNTPLFVIGVYSGELKLGEGFGSSIRMAEFRAAEDALRRLYLAQAPFDPQNLPSSTLQASSAPWESPAVGTKPYSAPPLGASEVLHGSRV